MRKLEAIQQDPALLSAFVEGMSNLYQSGVLDILREGTKLVQISPHTPNYVQVMASQAEFCRGYTQALEDLMYFRERFIDKAKPEEVPMQFGAVDRALRDGTITEGEADELRQYE